MIATPRSGRAGKSYSKNQHTFSVSQVGVNRERSTIDRPSRTMTALDADYIYPILVDEILPGDTFQLQLQMKGWLSTILKPFLENIYVDTFFFFVPNRLVWDNWTKFQGEKENPGDTTTYVIPQMEIAGGATAGAGKLADYMGIPTIATTFEVNALPFRGCNLIWNEFFRDTNLQDSVVVDKDDANSDEADYILMKRGKRKDYITGCLPWPQRGDAVSLSLATTAPVVAEGTGIPLFDGSIQGTAASINGPPAGGVTATWSETMEGTGSWSDTALEVDLSGATSITVNALRQSIAIQQILELDARGGTRYPEQLKARFGVTTEDHRLQRPEYLGGGHQNISVTPVPSTTENTNAAIGTLAGFGALQGTGGGFTHSFTEHGFLIAFASIRSDLTYQEGLPRFWSRTTRYDYYEPMLSHLGEQPVYNKEVFISNDANDDLVWGYQERFAEYKYGNSMITSVMRSDHPFPLHQWHLAQHFMTLPSLNDAFIQSSTPIDRIVAVTSEPHLLMDCYFTNKCTRVMPVFNTPGLTRF